MMHSHEVDAAVAEGSTMECPNHAPDQRQMDADEVKEWLEEVDRSMVLWERLHGLRVCS